MKTITASTRLDLNTPIVNVDASAIIAGKGAGTTGFVLSNLKTADITPDNDPVYIEVLIGGTKYYIAANPEEAAE